MKVKLLFFSFSIVFCSKFSIHTWASVGPLILADIRIHQVKLFLIRTQEGRCDEVCVFRGHSTEDFISLPSSSSSEVLSALISLPPEALPREERRVREIAGVLSHHPRNIDCPITVALKPIINTVQWWWWRRRSGEGGSTAQYLKEVLSR